MSHYKYLYSEEIKAVSRKNRAVPKKEICFNRVKLTWFLYKFITLKKDFVRGVHNNIS